MFLKIFTKKFLNICAQLLKFIDFFELAVLHGILKENQRECVKIDNVF